MPQITGALAALFNNVVAGASSLYIWRLYTITLFGGGVIQFADADFNIQGVTSTGPINISGVTFPACTLRIDEKQSKTLAHWKVGFDTDTYRLVVMPRPVDPVTGATFPDTIGNVPWLAAASAGALAAADFQVDEAYFGVLPTWPMPPGGAVPVGCRTIFKGVMGEVDTTSALAVLNVNDYRYLLSLSMPRHYFAAQCRHNLFDAGCNASGNMLRTAFAQSGTAAAGSTQSSIVGTALPAPGGSGTYALGSLKMTSGLNSGFWRTVKSWDGANTLTLLNPLPFAVAASDTFSVAPGCNWLFTTCQAFGNSNNYGGFPWIPAPETIGAA
jgi:hypothetical protein